MDQLIATFLERKSDWLTALFEHLRISLLALIIAIAIAVPLGLILSNKKKLTEWSLQVTGVFQTIPSLALLGLFIPLWVSARCLRWWLWSSMRFSPFYRGL